MRSFLIKRILQAAGVVICISALTFFILNVVPGDPVRVMMGDMADEQTVQQVRHTMGLDKPVPEQYANWFGKMLHGDFGTSYMQKKSVIALMSKALTVTLQLAICAYIFAVVLGLIMGIIAAVNHGRWLDRTLMSLAVLVFPRRFFGWPLCFRLYSRSILSGSRCPALRRLRLMYCQFLPLEHAMPQALLV